MLDQKRFAEADTRLREALSRYQETIPGEWRRFRAESLLGVSLVGQAKYGEAEPLLLEGYEGLLQRRMRMAAENRDLPERTGKWIIRLYEDWGKPEKAAEWEAMHLWPKEQREASLLASIFTYRPPGYGCALHRIREP